MMINRRTFTGTLVGIALVGAQPGSARGADEPILAILKRRIDVERRAVGLAVCRVTPRERSHVTWGWARASDAHPVTPHTVFEIGSITKVFTALLLAGMTLRGEVALDDPASRHLPGDFRLPRVNGREITLADLATHTSGLPRMPDFQVELFTAAWHESFARYGLDEFKTWLAGDLAAPPAEAGGWWYSNAGYALLGLALAHRGGRPFDELLQDRVLAPLGLRDTALSPTPSMKKRLAQGHNPDLTPTLPTMLGIFAPAGSLLSTARDLARFAAAILPGSGSRMEKEAQLLLTVRRPAPWLGGEQALGWETRNAPGGTFITKDGVTRGQTASMTFDPGKRLAIVVLSNTHPNLKYARLSSGGVGAADIAYHLMRPEIPLDGEGGALY